MSDIIKSIQFEKKRNTYTRGAPRANSELHIQISQQQLLNDVVSAAISGIVTGLVVREVFGGKNAS